jgi:hypothetical protein
MLENHGKITQIERNSAMAEVVLSVSYLERLQLVRTTIITMVTGISCFSLFLQEKNDLSRRFEKKNQAEKSQTEEDNFKLCYCTHACTHARMHAPPRAETQRGFSLCYCMTSHGRERSGNFQHIHDRRP